MVKRQERFGVHRVTNPETGEELVNTVRTETTDHGVAMEIGAVTDPDVRATLRWRDPDALRREREIEEVKRNVNRTAGKRRGDYAVPKPGGGVKYPRYTMVPCPTCEGAGETEIDGRVVECPHCHGDRMVESAY
ncbi:MAG: hypothetical protein WBA46_09550 [Thermomicrobiales bacterium]